MEKSQGAQIMSSSNISSYLMGMFHHAIFILYNSIYCIKKIFGVILYFIKKKSQLPCIKSMDHPSNPNHCELQCMEIASYGTYVHTYVISHCCKDVHVEDMLYFKNIILFRT